MSVGGPSVSQGFYFMSYWYWRIVDCCLRAKIEIIRLFFFISPPLPILLSAFRSHTSTITARAKVVSRSVYQCQVMHNTHISCGSDDVTRLSEESERQMELRAGPPKTYTCQNNIKPPQYKLKQTQCKIYSNEIVTM